MWIACSWCFPDIKVIWYSIESQPGKASDAIPVVVQCDGSQADSCRQYEQLLAIPCSAPHIIVTAPILFLSEGRISQFKLCAITMDVILWMNAILETRWIVPAVSTGSLRSSDRVIQIGIL